ncbi:MULTISPECIES: T9SS type A sorting domain-containing protein [Flavobacterium]|uniref:T9SS type A sorting domain-containing protein n=1 Tax=Flavobacterium TaxID=237 RepID=UPI001FCCBD68|nr:MULTISPECIES: T9SS type A sorting domain-containing protein [Flavobacterium]UOK42815.1 T9SS type A sorting domain-containing protein [Flavobacterium enshiense]
MRKYYLLLVCILSLGYIDTSFAQGAPQLQWVLNAANDANTPWGGSSVGASIAVDASGNRYVTGYFTDIADFDPSSGIANLTAIGTGDIFIAKYDSSGNYLWAKAIGGAYGDIGRSIALNNSGEVYVTGFFWQTADFDPSGATANLTSAGGSDAFVAKYDTNGNYLWAKAMGGASQDLAYSLVINSGGEVYVAGSFEGTSDFDPSAATNNITSAGNNDIFIAKYDTNGNCLWAKAMGGTSRDEAMAIALDGSGQIHITGYTGGGDFDPSVAVTNLSPTGETDIFIAKYDSNGNYIWAKSITSGISSQVGTSIVVKSDGNVYVTGYFSGWADFDPSTNTAYLYSKSDSQDVFIAGYSSNGDYLWAKAMGGTGIDEGHSIALDQYGDLWVAGDFSGTADFNPSSLTTNLVSNGDSDLFIAKYLTMDSRGGELVFARKRGGSKRDSAGCIVLKNNGNDHNVYVTGSFQETVAFNPPNSNLTAGTGASNCFIGHYFNSAGGFIDYRDAQAIGGYPNQSPRESGKSVATDSFGNVYVVGTFSGTADFDRSAATVTLTAAGGGDMFLAKYDSNGNYLWAKAIGGASKYETPMSIAVNTVGEVIIGGFFYDTTDFDPSAATANLTSQGDSDVFIAKYDSNGNYLWAKSMGGTGYEYSFNMVLNNSGQIHIIGELDSQSADFDPSGATAIISAINNTDGSQSADLYIAKYDTNGNYLWAKVLGGDQSGSMGFESKLVVNSSGEVYIGGGFSGTVDFDPSTATANLTSVDNSWDMFIAKYDSYGSYLWAKTMGGEGKHDIVKTIAVSSSGDLFVIGAFGSTVDFDPSAATVNLTATGETSNLFIAKYGSNGNYIWAKATGVIDNVWGLNPSSIALSSNDDMYIGGVFQGTGDFDPSAAVANLTSAGGNDMYVAKYDSNGNYLWAKAMGSAADDNVNSITLNSNGELYATGSFQNTVDFESVNTCNDSLTAMSEDMFLAKYGNGTCIFAVSPTVTQVGATLTVNSTADTYQWIDCDNGNAPIPGATGQSFTPAVSGNYAVVLTVGSTQVTSHCSRLLGVNDEEMASVMLYPNPTTGNFTISWAGELESAEIVVTDIMGKTIKTMQCQGQQEARLSLDGAANGIYFVRLQSGQKTKQFKLIKK